MAGEIYHAVGRRKSAVARVWMRPGRGTIVVNKRPIDEYFARETDRILITQPLEMTDYLGKFDITITVKGGGISGQAGAVRHGISRALVEIKPDLRLPLKKAELLRRDDRIKERKKYGLRGARARYQYSKR
ncbi:MAG: 30S ribosomal protein S9 [Deltaproteobacteria bacterium]|nr:30S ribosomal protein S9 [Deltaproteobacteria bacterium]